MLFCFMASILFHEVCYCQLLFEANGVEVIMVWFNRLPSSGFMLWIQCNKCYFVVKAKAKYCSMSHPSRTP